MSQSSYFKSRPDLLTFGGVGRGNLGKTLRVEESGWSLVDRINKCPWYLIGRIVLDSLSLGDLGGGVQWFSEFGASGWLGRWKLVGVSGSCTNGLDKAIFPDLTIWGAKGRGKSRKNEVFITYELVIGSEWILIFTRASWLRTLILNPDRH